MVELWIVIVAWDEVEIGKFSEYMIDHLHIKAFIFDTYDRPLVSKVLAHRFLVSFPFTIKQFFSYIFQSLL